MVEIANLTTNPINEDIIRNVCRKVLEGEGKQECDISVVLVGAGRMRKLNKRYRGKNRATDVLSFGSGQQPKFIMPPGQELLGEIVICVPVIKKNAKRFSSTFEKELSLSLIHGILHLLGYDHEKSKKMAEKMKNKQQHYMAQVIIR